VPYHLAMPIDTSGESYMALRSLLDQVADNDSPATARIAATIAAQQYLEALTRTLVDEALEQEGATWDDLAQSFGTTPANVKSRFGSYRRYD
jgi:transcriptional regulator with GAF, ATPase, and Fis domain